MRIEISTDGINEFCINGKIQTEKNKIKTDQYISKRIRYYESKLSYPMVIGDRICLTTDDHDNSEGDDYVCIILTVKDRCFYQEENESCNPYLMLIVDVEVSLTENSY